MSENQEKAKKQGTLTLCQAQREGQVRKLKETERARGTYSLLSAEGGTSQKTKRNQESEGYSRAVKRRGISEDTKRKRESE